MSAWWWLLWAAAWLGIGTVIACQIGHARRAESDKDRIVREARERTAGMVPAAPDNEEGTRLDWADECALIYSMPDYERDAAAVEDGLSRLFEQLGPPPAYDPAWEPGLERLWDAVRDEHDHQRGDQ